MKKNRILTKFLMLIVLLPMLNMLQAQLTVVGSGDVGIGTASPWAKLSVFNNNLNSFNVTIEDYNASGFKLGVYNSLYEPSGGTVYGLYNIAQTSSVGGSGSALGFLNYADAGDGYVVGQQNYTYQFGGSSQGSGIRNDVYTSTQGDGYGIYNNLSSFSRSGGGLRWGIYNYVSVNPGQAQAIGVYSSTAGAGNYAGYFDGNVRVVGTFTVISDESKKENIAKLDNALSIVQRLKGHSYTFKADPNMNLPEGQQYGFLAQELEAVLPELVNTGENPNHPSQTDAAFKPLKKGEKPTVGKPDAALGSETVKSVNYIAVIPILVEAIKEQQVTIERQQQQIQALEAKVNK
jgi:hypothetical protein